MNETTLVPYRLTDSNGNFLAEFHAVKGAIDAGLIDALVDKNPKLTIELKSDIPLDEKLMAKVAMIAASLGTNHMVKVKNMILLKGKFGGIFDQLQLNGALVQNQSYTNGSKSIGFALAPKAYKRISEILEDVYHIHTKPITGLECAGL